MKKLMTLTLAALIWGCGSYGNLSGVNDGIRDSEIPERMSPGEHGAPTPGSPEATLAPRPSTGIPDNLEVGSDPSGSSVALRLRGEDLGPFRSVIAQVRDVRVEIDGRPVAVDVEREPLDLTAPNHAWLVGQFTLPNDAKNVKVTLAFEDLGQYESDLGAGPIDFRAPPITFDAPATYFTQRGHGVVHLDVAKSLVPLANGHLLLPNLQVHY